MRTRKGYFGIWLGTWVMTGFVGWAIYQLPEPVFDVLTASQESAVKVLGGIAVFTVVSAFSLGLYALWKLLED